MCVYVCIFVCTDKHTYTQIQCILQENSCPFLFIHKFFIPQTWKTLPLPATPCQPSATSLYFRSPLCQHPARLSALFVQFHPCHSPAVPCHLPVTPSIPCICHSLPHLPPLPNPFHLFSPLLIPVKSLSTPCHLLPLVSRPLTPLSTACHPSYPLLPSATFTPSHPSSCHLATTLPTTLPPSSLQPYNHLFYHLATTHPNTLPPPILPPFYHPSYHPLTTLTPSILPPCHHPSYKHNYLS